MYIDFRALLSALTDSQVEFIVIGGAAATAHGAIRLTIDLDVVYRRTPNNVTRLVAALTPFQPYLRGAPPNLPFKFDQATIARGLNFTLTTSAGAIDLLGEVTGGGSYDDLFPNTVRLQLFGIECLCLSLDQLIHVKRAAGRPKDFEAIAELEAIRDDQKS